MKKSPFIIVLLALSIALAGYTFLRSATLSLTHDESSTVLNHINKSVIKCMYTPDCWRAANSHPLNTMGVSFFTRIFGQSEWAVRLINWLSHLLYLGCSIVLIRLIKPHWLIGLFGFLAINFHPYLLEFFGLARGYGLATACVMGTLTFSWLYFEQQRMRWMALAWLFAVLAVLSNFTTLIFFIAFVMMWTAVGVYNRGAIMPKHEDRNWAIGAICLFGLASLLYIPFTALSKNGEFLWGVDTFGSSMLSITTHYLLGRNYSGTDFPAILSGVMWLGVSSTALFLLWKGIKRRQKNHGETFIAGAFILVLIGLVMNHHLMGAKYPDGRKLLFLVPFLSVLLFLGAHHLHQKAPRVAYVLSVLSAFWLTFHMVKGANTHRTTDWYYDQRTKEAYQLLKSEMEKSPTASAATYWIFSPSMNYYNRRTSGTDPFPIDRLSKVEAGLDYQYLYVETGQIKPLLDKYEVWHDLGFGTLLKKKN